LIDDLINKNISRCVDELNFENVLSRDNSPPYKLASDFTNEEELVDLINQLDQSDNHFEINYKDMNKKDNKNYDNKKKDKNSDNNKINIENINKKDNINNEEENEEIIEDNEKINNENSDNDVDTSQYYNYNFSPELIKGELNNKIDSDNDEKNENKNENDINIDENDKKENENIFEEGKNLFNFRNFITIFSKTFKFSISRR
jgi:hypothetical protein